MNKVVGATMMCALLLGGCAAKPSPEQTASQQNVDPRDPLEPVNRVLWDFNWDVLDRYLLKPAATVYVTVMPQFARTGLSNAVDNLSEPTNAVNNMLQGKVQPSFESLSRFIINSTIGIVGVFDVAGAMGMPRQQEDFGEVLGVWGVDTGPFLMVPARGPSDARSFTGDLVDNLYGPLSLLTGTMNVVRFSVSALEGRAQLIGQEGQIDNALDDYQMIKNIYFQNLEYRVTDGKSVEQAPDEAQLENFEEFESMFDDVDLEKE